MPDPIGFYFDFLSPYGYMGGVGIERVAERTGRAVDWRPMLLGVTVLNIMGLKPIPDTPLKGAYAGHDWKRTARWLDVPHDPDADVRFQSLAAMRAFVWIRDQDPGLAKRFAQAVFAAHWAEGRGMSDPNAVAGEAARLGLEADACLEAMADARVKQLLRTAVDASVERGVFGCPTFEVDGELFWGVDRLDQVEDWIKTGGW